MPIYALHQGYGATDIGLIVACFSASNLVLSVPIGRLVDRRGLQFPWRGSVWLALLGQAVVLLITAGVAAVAGALSTRLERGRVDPP